MNIKQALNSIKVFALDMDGTIYLGEELFPFTKRFLERVEETGRKSVYLTNNSSKSAEAYMEKLTRMGIDVDARQLITSGHATVSLLKQSYPGKRVFLLGNPALREEFEALGVAVTDGEPELVVTAFDTNLTYERLCRVCDLVRSGLPYLATHPDYNCPTEHGFVPDIGATHAYIHASTGRWPDAVAGKPYRPIVDEVLNRTGLAAHEIAMVGDRLYTDIRTGKDHGLLSILVMSGETNAAMLEQSDVKPDLVFDSLEGIAEYL